MNAAVQRTNLVKGVIAIEGTPPTGGVDIKRAGQDSVRRDPRRQSVTRQRASIHGSIDELGR
jgi:hypothetical protein